MNKQHYLLIALFLLSGCDYFSFDEKQQSTQNQINQADVKAKRINKKYEMKIRKIKPYEGYNYKSDNLEDPFAGRDFAIRKEEAKKMVKAAKKCIPPKCVPPTPHEKMFLENYPLSALRFVGKLKDQGLIKVPDYGEIISIDVGDYMGENNGKVLTVKDSAIIVQEKIYKSGIWENKKSVLKITQ